MIKHVVLDEADGMLHVGFDVIQHAHVAKAFLKLFATFDVTVGMAPGSFDPNMLHGGVRATMFIREVLTHN